MSQDDGLNRRKFIGAGGIALAFAAAPVSWGLARDSQAPYRAIYDERYEAGRAFAVEASGRAWATRAIRGGITTVWFRELAPRWRMSPAPVMGVTTPQTLFVLERLAWDAGMRVTSRNISATTSVVRWVIDVPRSQDHHS